MELMNGRPANCEGRLEKEIRCYDLLDSLGIDYQRIDHEPANTMEACAAVDEALKATICKNLLLCNRQCTQFYLLLLPGGKIFKTSAVSKQIGSSRLSFAPEEMLFQRLRCHGGSASPLGLIFPEARDVTLIVDSALRDVPTLAFHPCDNTRTVAMSAGDFFGVFLPKTGVEAVDVKF